MDAKILIAFIICFIGVVHGKYNYQAGDDDETEDPLVEVIRSRSRRDAQSVMAQVMQDFIMRGGIQAVTELANSQDKLSVLKRVLGEQVALALVGQGLIGRLVSSYGGGRGAGAGGGRGVPSAHTPPPLPPGGNGRWDPAPAAPSGGAGRHQPPAASGGVTPHPDDTEY